MSVSGDEDDFMQDMDKLKELDPEFYEYLQENDRQLLDFKGADEEQDVAPESSAQGTEKDIQVLTRDKLNAMTTRASQAKCFKTLRAMLAAYRVAARMSTGSNEAAKLRIDDVSVFNTLLEWVLTNVPALIEHHAGSRKKGDPMSACARWHRVKMVAHQFWGESLFLIQQLTATETLEYVLKCLSTGSALELLTPLTRLKPLVLKQLSQKWASTEAQGVREAASALLIKYCQTVLGEVKGGKPEKTLALEGILKRLIHDYAIQLERNPGRTGTNEYMAGIFGDMISLDEDAGFRVTVSSLRQLATVLSAAINEKKTNTAQSAAFSLSFVRSVQMWVKIIGRFKSLSTMVFPMSSVITIACKAKESHTIYLPYLSLMAAEANALMECSQKFIPISATLLKALTIPSKRYHEIKASSSTKFPNVETTAKLQESQLKDNKPLLAALISAMVKRLAEHLELLARTPAFKEVAYPVMVHLRKIIKQFPSTKQMIRPLVTACEETSELCCKARAGLTAVPEELFSIQTASGPLKKLLTEASVTPQNSVHALVASGKATILKTADIKKDAAILDSLSKRAQKRRRQKTKMVEQRATKKAKKVAKKKEGREGLEPMIISDDDE